MPNQMTSVFSESNSRRIYHSTSTSTLLVLSASFNCDNYAAGGIRRSLDDDSVATLVHAFVVSRVDYCGSLDPDWRSEEDDRKVATCPQLGSTDRLEHVQVRPGAPTHAFPAKSATLAGRCRPGSVQSLRPCRCSDVCRRWLLNTCLPIAKPSPASLAVATCDRLTVVI